MGMFALAKIGIVSLRISSCPTSTDQRAHCPSLVDVLLVQLAIVVRSFGIPWSTPEDVRLRKKCHSIERETFQRREQRRNRSLRKCPVDVPLNGNASDLFVFMREFCVDREEDSFENVFSLPELSMID
jgi:hypothetical protein